MTERVAIITGGSRGIGAEIARKLADDGMNIVLSYAGNVAAAEQTAGQIREKGRKVLTVKADNASVEGNLAVIAAALAEFGRIDVLVCNTGTYPQGLISEVSVEDINNVLNLNLRSAMIETMEATKHMKQGGRLIYIGSAFGERAPFPGIALYSATKAALRGFAQGVARDMGQSGITANVIQPGPIDTDMNPASGEHADINRSFTATKSYGKTTDIARAASFLASPDAGYITGTVLTVDGGLCA